MTRPIPPLDGDPDVRGRTVVWSVGSAPEARPGRRRHPLVRRLGLVLLSAAAVFSLAYAVHAWVVISPPPAGPVVPLWLPEQLPADAADDHAARPTVTATPAREAEPRDRARTSGSGSRADDHGSGSGRSSSSSSPGSDDRGSRRGSSGGGSSTGSGGGSHSGSGRGGSDDGASDDHGSHGSGRSGGSSHGGDDS